jgi:hypothetical protein
MTMFVSRIIKACVLPAILLTAANAYGQTTLWNAPSTDVQTTGKTYAEADFFTHFAAADKGGFQSYGSRFVYGLRKKMEVGFNAFYTKAGDVSVPVEVQPNFKLQIFNDEAKGVAVSVGGMAYVPVNHRAGTDTFGLVYSTMSKKTKADHGPRLTGGFYQMIGRDKGLGARTGAIAGIEQPMFKRMSFVADWYSGKNRFGYAGGGLAFVVSKKSLLYAGYNVGNQGRGNNYFSVLYGYTF